MEKHHSFASVRLLRGEIFAPQTGSLLLMRPYLDFNAYTCKICNCLTHEICVSDASCLCWTQTTAHCCTQLGFIVAGCFIPPVPLPRPNLHKISSLAVQEEPKGESTLLELHSVLCTRFKTINNEQWLKLKSVFGPTGPVLFFFFLPPFGNVHCKQHF